jgi:hypothetical protein
VEKSIACVEINFGLLSAVGQEALAALPLDVRKGYAFLGVELNLGSLRLCRLMCGKAVPFRLGI